MATAFPQFAGRDVLIDTNLLLLGVLGAFDRRLIGKRRLERFTVEDFVLLDNLSAMARSLITTPGILTETSNLALQVVGEKRGPDFFARFCEEIKRLDERHEKAATVCDDPAFTRFGLTDATIIRVARDGILVLTTDWKLAGALLKAGVDALNFNHLRNI